MIINPTKQTVYGGFSTSNVNYNNSGMSIPFKIEVPAPIVEINKTLQYEFRVLESVKNGELIKVGLQVKTYELDHYGTRVMICDWTDVERVRLEV
jgi:hypothetical protein